MDPFRLFKRKEGAASPLLGKGRDVASALGSGAEKLDATRAAHNTGDSARSKSLHDGNAAAAAEDHGGSAICGYELGDFIKSVVFGGLDGIITTFAVVASVAGANLPLQVIILSGFAKLIGDGLAMGLGDCMSEAAEEAHIRGERKREAWEMANYPEGEIAEMVEIYKQKGFSHEEAARIIDLMTKSPKTHEYFVDHMLTQELGHLLPDDDVWGPFKNGGVTFSSFMFFGSLPLWPYVLFFIFNWQNDKAQLGICVAVTAACLFLLGATQAKIVRQNWVKLGMLMTINGGLAALASYLIGWGLQQAVGGKVCL